MASRDSRPPRHDQPGAELRVRALRAKDRGQGYRGTRPKLVAGCVQRSRAGERRHDGAICGAISEIWIPAAAGATRDFVSAGKRLPDVEVRIIASDGKDAGERR